MGDFSISCGMSGLSLINTNVVLFPLIPNAYEGPDGKFQFNQHNIVSNEGATALFEPYTLPIFGELYSYGTLDTIESDYNTKSLEKRFNRTIDFIAEQFCYPDEEGHMFPTHRTGMLIHRKVWDEFSTPGLDEWGKRIKLEDYKGTPRKDTWLKTIRQWKERERLRAQSLEMFKKQDNTDKETIELFSRVSYFDLQYILSFGAKQDVESVLDIYPDAMDSEDFYNMMEKLHCFRWNMMACNRLFMPTFNGYQYGNFYMARELAQLTFELANKEVMDYEKEWKEDE